MGRLCRRPQYRRVIRERQRYRVDVDHAPHAASGNSRPSDVYQSMRGVSRREHVRRLGIPVACRHRHSALARPDCRDYPERIWPHAGLFGSAAGDAGSTHSVRDERRGERGNARRARNHRHEIRFHRISSVVRSRGLSLGGASVGNAERDRFEFRRVCLEDSTRRISGVGRARPEGHGHGELWRPYRDCRRGGLHRPNQLRQEIARLRQGHRQAVMGRGDGELRQRNSDHVRGQRQAIRRDRGVWRLRWSARRAGGRRVRRVRIAVMNSAVGRLKLLAGLIAAVLTPSTRRASAQDAPLVIAHVAVVDVVAGRVQPDMTVEIRGRTIAGINAGSRARIRRRATVIDGRGGYLIPALWDMHVHASWPPAVAQIFLPVMVANGVLGVRDMHSGSLSVIVALKRAVANGSQIGPRVFVAGPAVDGPNSYLPGSRVVRTADEAREAVRQLEAGGVDFIKVYSSLPRELYFVVASEAKKEGIPFVGHVPYAVTAAEASDAGQRSVEHLTGGVVGTSRTA